MYRLSKPFIITVILLVGFGFVVHQIVFGQVTPALAAGPDLVEADGIAWGPCYYTDDLIVMPEMNRAELDFMREIDRQTLTGRRFSPSYVGENAIVAPGPAPDAFGGVAWGPSYEVVPILGPVTERGQELTFMKFVDRNALTSRRFGPSYDPDETFGSAPSNPNPVIIRTWGPSYYADDAVIEGKGNVGNWDLKNQVDPNPLDDMRWGPSYYVDDPLVGH